MDFHPTRTRHIRSGAAQMTKLRPGPGSGNALDGQMFLKMARTSPRPVSRLENAQPPERRKRTAGLAPVSPDPPKAARARRKFLKVFPDGFEDEAYLDWERGYKQAAHEKWQAAFSKRAFEKLIEEGKFEEIAATATRIESHTNLLFSFEKMALRDAVRSPAGAKSFAVALYAFLHGADPLDARFSDWVEAIGGPPRRKTRVLTWPLATVFGFLAQPETHFFLKPTVTREAARRYGMEFPYAPRPSWPLYKGILDFVGQVRSNIADLRPRDMIDMQSFLWVQGSDEYPD